VSGVAVSVLVPVRDNAAGVEALLAAFEHQTLARDRFEVVVADDGSRDDLERAVAAARGDVRLLRGPPTTSYAARNRAAGEARGAVLAFCDSDCVPEPRWLEAGLEAIGSADVVAGEVVFRPPPAPTAWSLLTIDMFLDQERNVAFGRAVTANLFVRRELFARLGGFDETLPSGGDYDFAARAVAAGARLRLACASVVCHPTLDERRPFLRKVWSTNRWAAARHARSGERPDLGGLLTVVPVLGVALARRGALRPMLGLERTRLERAGLRPTRSQEAHAVVLLYFVVAYVAGTARLVGWLEGRRLARAGYGPRYAATAAGSSAGGAR
jgi:GT2 family glycosyltransferase